MDSLRFEDSRVLSAFENLVQVAGQPVPQAAREFLTEIMSCFSDDTPQDRIDVFAQVAEDASPNFLNFNLNIADEYAKVASAL